MIYKINIKIKEQAILVILNWWISWQIYVYSQTIGHFKKLDLDLMMYVI